MAAPFLGARLIGAIVLLATRRYQAVFGRYRPVVPEKELVIPARFNGPPGSANGGYTCGLLAGWIDGVAEVTLRAPPPLARPLRVVPDGSRAELRDGERLVADASAVAADLGLDIPSPVSVGAAEAASRRFAGFVAHAYSTCFVCGADRTDGLGIYAGPVEGREGLVAAHWTPVEEVSEVLVWAALDCPSGWAVDDFQREGLLLGRLAARIDALPTAGEAHVVVGWRRAIDGRKRFGGSAVFTADGELVALARSTWIQSRLLD
jgi:hypothetical protein